MGIDIKRFFSSRPAAADTASMSAEQAYRRATSAYNKLQEALEKLDDHQMDLDNPWGRHQAGAEELALERQVRVAKAELKAAASAYKKVAGRPFDPLPPMRPSADRYAAGRAPPPPRSAPRPDPSPPPSSRAGANRARVNGSQPNQDGSTTQLAAKLRQLFDMPPQQAKEQLVHGLDVRALSRLQAEVGARLPGEGPLRTLLVEVASDSRRFATAQRAVHPDKNRVLAERSALLFDADGDRRRANIDGQMQKFNMLADILNKARQHLRPA